MPAESHRRFWTPAKFTVYAADAAAAQAEAEAFASQFSALELVGRAQECSPLALARCPRGCGRLMHDGEPCHRWEGE